MEYEERLVQLPKELIGKELIITTGNSECIIIFEKEQWKAYEECWIHILSTNKNARRAGHMIFGRAFDTIPDKEGYIYISGFMWFIHFGEKQKVRVHKMEDYLKGREEYFVFGKEHASYVIVAEE